MRRAETAEMLRERIRTTQLLKRAEAFALGENDPQSGKPIEMSPTQATVLLGLLGKTLPNLASVEQTIEDSRQRVVSGEALSDDKWEQQYGDSLAAAARTSESAH